MYCISWLRQISEFDCCSCPSNIPFKFIIASSSLNVPSQNLAKSKEIVRYFPWDIFSIFEKFFIFIKLEVLNDTLFHGFTG